MANSRAILPTRGGLEALCGSIRRECLDQVIVYGEAHLRRVLQVYASYYNETGIHRCRNKDAPLHRRTQRIGILRSHPILGRLPSMSGASFRYTHPEANALGIKGNGGIDCTPDHRGFSFRFGASVPDPRPGLRLWPSLKTAPPCDGHSGQTHRASIAVAKRLCRTTDRVHSLRMLGSHHRLW